MKIIQNAVHYLTHDSVGMVILTIIGIGALIGLSFLICKPTMKAQDEKRKQSAILGNKIREKLAGNTASTPATERS